METEREWNERRQQELAEATPELVRTIVHTHLDWWETSMSLRGRFAWCDDGLSHYGWHYRVHCAAVGDWNATNRAEPFEIFLRRWVEDETKVWNSLKTPTRFSKF